MSESPNTPNPTSRNPAKMLTEEDIRKDLDTVKPVFEKMLEVGVPKDVANEVMTELLDRWPNPNASATAEVIALPWVERRDLLPDSPADGVLEGALENGVTSPVVVGFHRDGHFYVASEHGDIDKTVGMLMRAVAFLTRSDVDFGKVKDIKE